MDNLVTWVIYRLWNKLNGQSYIGQTKNPKRRMTVHKNNGQLEIGKAIKNFGWDNFEKQILHSGIKSKAEASDWESFYIREFNSVYPNGYNQREKDGHTSDLSALKCGKSNQGKKKGRGSYMGIRQSAPNSFTVMLRFQGKQIGKNFKTEIEAAEAYDRMVLYIYGSDAKLNFPEKRNEYLEENLEDFYTFFTATKKKNKYYGVIKKGNKWVAIIKQRNFKCFFGISAFDSEEEAARMVDKIRVAFNLKCKNPFNFPEEVSSYNAIELKTYFESCRPENQELRNIRKRGNRFSVSITFRNKRFNLGSFESKEEAIAVRDTFLDKNGLKSNEFSK